MAIDELEKPWNRGRGNFLLKELAIPEDEEREQIVSDFETLDEFAGELSNMNADERKSLDEDIDDRIKLAKGLYRRLDEIEDTDSRPLVM
jgi:hypothetical protein